MTEIPEATEGGLGHGGPLSWIGPEGIGDSLFEVIEEPPPLEMGAGPDADPAVELRRTLGRFATGVTVITTVAAEQVHGMTANAFMSVSLSPPLVVVSVDRRARMHRLLNEGRLYGVSVLAADQQALSDHFAGRVAEEPIEPGFVEVHDTPLVEGATAHLVARVAKTFWGGDHSLFVGRVEYCRWGEDPPLVFFGGRYRTIGEETG